MKTDQNKKSRKPRGPNKKPKCGARTKHDGTPCKLSAGHRTDHPGEGRCWLHGGRSPIKHGRYSKIKRPRIRELIDQYDKDPNPLDLMPEAALLRALTTDFVERYDNYVDAMQLWHAHYTKAFKDAVRAWQRAARDQIQRELGVVMDDFAEIELPPIPDPRNYIPDRPMQIVDISAAATLADKVGSMVDRIEKYRQKNLFTVETLERVLELLGVELVKAAQEEISDAIVRSRLLANFERRWAKTQFDPTERAAEGSEAVYN